jgi:hypothetical protein
MSRFLPPVPPDHSGFYGIVVKDDITAVITDSIEFLGTDFDVSASGDGALVELDASVGTGGAAFVSQSFSSSYEWIYTHNLGTTDLVWSAYTDQQEALIPSKVDVSNSNIAYFYFSALTVGKVVLASGASSILTAASDFASSQEWIFNHSLNKSDIQWSTYTDQQEALIPSKVDISDPDTTYFYFSSATAGRAVLIGF